MQTVLSVIAIVVGACAAFAGADRGNRWLQLRERRILLMTELIPMLVSHIMHGEKQLAAGIGNPFRNDLLVVAHKIHWQLVITPGKPAAEARRQLARLQSVVVHANSPTVTPEASVLLPALAEIKQAFVRLQRHLAKKLRAGDLDSLPIP